MVYCGGITSGSMFPFDTKFNDRLSEAWATEPELISVFIISLKTKKYYISKLTYLLNFFYYVQSKQWLCIVDRKLILHYF
jgi:hypothetical protein